MPRIEIQRIEEESDFAETSSEPFDRAAFTEHAIRLVRPPRTRIAIGESARRVTVESGRAWGKGPDARWAVIRVPRDASRRAIARAVLALHVGPPRAWAFDVLMAACATDEQPPVSLVFEVG